MYTPRQVVQLSSPGDLMCKTGLTVREVLSQLETFYGEQAPCWPSDPYLFLLWWCCGYPASDASCTKGWKELTSKIGTDPDAILAARPARLAAAFKPGGMLPELRTERMKEVAARIKDEFSGDLRGALTGPITKVRKILKSFPSIAEPCVIAWLHQLSACLAGTLHNETIQAIYAVR